MIPVLLLLLLCTQMSVYKTPMRNYETNLFDALNIKAEQAVESIKQKRRLPPNLKGFKLRWTQKIERDEEKGSISIYTPWYFKAQFGYLLVSLVLFITIGYVLNTYDLSQLFATPIPAVLGANKYWVAGSGNWNDDDNHWALSSGGAAGDGNKPGAGDAVFVDNGSDVAGAAFAITLNEATATLGTVTINCTDAVATINCGANNFVCDASGGANALIQANGVFNCNTATGHSFGVSSTWWGMSIGSGATFDGDSATISSGAVLIGDGCTFTATSGVHTVANAYNQTTCDALNIEDTATFANGSGTFTFTKASATQTINNLNAVALSTVIVNGSACVVRLESDLTCATLTITQGTLNTLDTDNATSRALTTTNACNVSGTLTLNASTVSCTGTGTTNGYSCEIAAGGAGTVTGGSGGHTYGSIACQNGGALTLTSGITIINSNRGADNLCFQLGDPVTFDDGDGTLSFTKAGTQNIRHQANVATTFYNVTINNPTADLLYYSTGRFAMTVANNLTITAGSFTTWDGTTSANLTVTGTTSVTGSLIPQTATHTYNGAVTVNSGGVLGGNTAWTCDVNGTANILVASGGTYNAPNSSGAWTFYGFTFNTGGVFNNDGGTANCDIAEGSVSGTGSPVFYNLTFTGNGASHYWASGAGSPAQTVQNALTCAGSAYVWLYSTTYTIGTVAAAGSAALNAGFLQANVSLTTTIQAASATYPVVVTGTDVNWDYRASATWNLKWLDYQIDATTGGGGCTVNFTGNMTIDGWTVSAGDTATISNSVTITEATGKSFTASGALTMGTGITWNGGTLVINANSTFGDLTLGTGTGLTVNSGKQFTPNNGGSYNYANFIYGSAGYPTVTLWGADPIPWGILQSLTIAGTFNPSKIRFENCRAEYTVGTNSQKATVRKAMVFKSTIFEAEI